MTGEYLPRDLLHDYQRYLVARIKDTPRCGLFVEMGLGKTISALTAIVDLYDDFEICRVLIIAPLRVTVSTWPDEIHSWEHTHGLDFAVACGTAAEREAAIRRGATITLINRENVVWLVKWLKDRKRKWPYDMVVIDESSSFKSHAAKRFKALRAALPQIERMVLLTGTPAPNGLLDLWAQVYLLDQGRRLGKHIGSYRDCYFDSDYMGYKWTPREGAAERIHARISDICFSLRARDYLDLPKRIDNEIRLKLPDELRGRYDDFEREFLMELESQEVVTAVSAGVLAGKLLQFCNGAVYDEDGKAHVLHDLKLDALESVIEEAAGSPVLLAYNFKSDLARIKKRFKQAVALDKNPETIRRFQRGEISLLCCHPASAGHGLNLQARCHTMVWFGANWSLELYLQFVARLDRQGQKHTVMNHLILFENTIDMDVVDRLLGRHEDQNALLAAVKARVERNG